MRCSLKSLAVVVCIIVVLLPTSTGFFHQCHAIGFMSPVRKQTSEINYARNANNIPNSQFLTMSSNDQSRTSTQINFLLTKAVDLINKMTSKKKPKEGEADVEVIATKKNIVRIPVQFSFSSTHKHEISLRDPVAALEYLSLPVEAYSVLDSNLVTRSLVADDTFIMSLPLGDLSSASQIATGGTMGVKLAATLRTEVTVRPDPTNGRVVMESGPIYFTPTPSKLLRPASASTVPVASESEQSSLSESGVLTSNSAVDEETPEGFADALPEWLLWGGRPTAAAAENNNVIDHNQDQYSSEESDEKKEEFKAKADEAVKSSVQARFRIELQWKSFKVSELTEEKGLSGFMSNMRSLFSSRDAESVEVDSDVRVITNSDGTDSEPPVEDSDVSRGDTSDAPHFNREIIEDGVEMEEKIKEIEGKVDETVMEEEISLPVTAVVKVWVDVNLPVRDDLSSALSFPPIKLLLSQAGSLTTKAVLITLAPVLGTLLVRDHDIRRKKIEKNQNSEGSNYGTASGTSSSPASNRKSENIYEELTSGIEIK